MKNILFVLSLGLILSIGSCQKDSRIDKSELTVVDDSYLLEGDKFTGVAYENYTNGKVKNEWTLSAGILNGPFSSHYSDGKVDESLYWKDGLKDGPYEKHYSNGQLQVKAQYALNEKDGYFEVFYEDCRRVDS